MPLTPSTNPATRTPIPMIPTTRPMPAPILNQFMRGLKILKTSTLSTMRCSSQQMKRALTPKSTSKKRSGLSMMVSPAAKSEARPSHVFEAETNDSRIHQRPRTHLQLSPPLLSPRPFRSLLPPRCRTRNRTGRTHDLLPLYGGMAAA